MKRYALLILLAGALAADCPGSDSTGPGDDNGQPSIVGAWTLVAVNNDPLPAEVDDGESSFIVTSGSCVVNANGTFTYTEMSGEEGTDVTPGTWVAASTANTYTFTPTANPEEENQGVGTVVVSGNTAVLTVSTNPGVTRQLQRN